MPRNRIRDFLVPAKNRVRAYSRWPLDPAERIEAAKVEISAAMFFHRAGVEMPEDIVRRSNGAFDVLEREQVPMVQWE